MADEMPLSDDSNFWSINQSSSAGVNAGRHAGHIRHVW